jgi:hypothetical protein
MGAAPRLPEDFKKTVYWEEEDYTTVYKNITCPSYYFQGQEYSPQNKTNRSLYGSLCLIVVTHVQIDCT